MIDACKKNKTQESVKSDVSSQKIDIMPVGLHPNTQECAKLPQLLFIVKFRVTLLSIFHCVTLRAERTNRKQTD